MLLKRNRIHRVSRERREKEGEGPRVFPGVFATVETVPGLCDWTQRCQRTNPVPDAHPLSEGGFFLLPSGFIGAATRGEGRDS